MLDFLFNSLRNVFTSEYLGEVLSSGRVLLYMLVLALQTTSMIHSRKLKSLSSNALTVVIIVSLVLTTLGLLVLDFNIVNTFNKVMNFIENFKLFRY